MKQLFGLFTFILVFFLAITIISFQAEDVEALQCADGQRACDGNTAYWQCNDEGEWSNSQSCGDEKPYCSGKGNCVSCRVNAHCPSGAGLFF